METTVSIIVPLFNEEENVAITTQKIIGAVGADPNFLELVLVDDGSRDRTAALARELSAADPRVRLMQHEVNQGLGAAIRTGLRAAEADYVLYTDADLPFDFELIPELVALAGPHTLVAGYRLNRGEGGRRWVLTKAYNFLIWLLFGLSVNDVNFACKIMPRRFLEKAALNSEGSFIDVEILLEARRLDLGIAEHPLVYYPRERGLSTLSRPGVIFAILLEMAVYLSTLLGSAATLVGFVDKSPLAGLSICTATALVSGWLLFEKTYLHYAAVWLLLAASAGVISLALSRRIGFAAAALAVAAAEAAAAWQRLPFLSAEIYSLMICAALGIVFARLVYQSWIYVQKSLRLNFSND